MRNRRWRQPGRAPVIVREIDGQRFIGRQTRELAVGDVVLVTETETAELMRIVRHQGDLIYLLSDLDGHNERWVHATFLSAKIVWPKIN